MAQCKKCGKKGLFLRINQDGLCSECDKKEKDPEYIAAKEYVAKLSCAVEAATKYSVVLPSRGAECVSEQMSACSHAIELIDEWKNYSKFTEAFLSTATIDKKPYGGYLTHPIFRFSVIPSDLNFDFEKAFAELRWEIEKLRVDCMITSRYAYDYDKLFHVVGVTFYNENKSRQAIIKRLGKGYKDNPERLHLERYEFEGEDAVGVFFGKNQIGNIARYDLPWLIEHWEEYAYISAYDVEGYDTLGVYIRACFRKKKNEDTASQGS